MKTELLKFNEKKCLDIINNKHVLAFPTETVFGFGVIYDSKEAFDELCALKQRVPDKPFTIMVSEKSQISQFVDLTPRMHRLIDVFMPGEITVLFPTKKGLYPWLTLNQPTVGIRISALKEVQDLIARVGKPMLVTSANMSGTPALLTSDSVLEQFDNKIYGIVEGVCESNIPSTIVLIDGENLKLIRQGSIPFETILNEWRR